MAHTASSLPLHRLPAGPSKASPEESYWRTFKSPKLVSAPSNSPINSITSAYTQHSSSRAALQNDAIAVTAGMRVLLIDGRTRAITKQISRFPSTAHSAHFRPSDARILVAGDEGGGIQVFDTSSRAILKSWKGTPNSHRQGVWVTRFSPTETTLLMSASDDGTMREWDLTADVPICTFSGHGDYVRAGSYMPGIQTHDLLVSGSYDQTVKIWDRRAPERAVLTFKHAAPIEAVLPMPSGTTVLASAGERIAVLDLVAGKSQKVLTNHQKTVTTLSLASKGSRVVSGGLDGHVKVFEAASWTVVAGMKYNSPVLAASVIPSSQGDDDRHLMVGLQSGLISIKTRLVGVEKARERARQKEMAAMLEGKLDEHDAQVAKKQTLTSGRRARLRGRDFTGEGADVVIEGDPRSKRKKLKPWEHELRNARYSTALDLVMDTGDVGPIVTVFVALRHRSAMRTALADRDEVSLQPILRWVCRHIIDPRHAPICVEVGLQILDMYAMYAGQSVVLDDLLRQLHRQVRREIDRSEQACQTSGMLGLLLKP